MIRTMKMRKSSMRKRGMTLVEVVVFLTLALFILGGSFPLVTRLYYSDRMHEERLAAFNLGNSTIEQLRATKYSKLTDGFTKKTVGGTVYYIKTYASTNFYKNQNLKMVIILAPKYNSTLGEYYRGTIRMMWNSRISPSRTRPITEQLTALFFPDL